MLGHSSADHAHHLIGRRQVGQILADPLEEGAVDLAPLALREEVAILRLALTGDVLGKSRCGIVNRSWGSHLADGVPTLVQVLRDRIPLS